METILKGEPKITNLGKNSLEYLINDSILLEDFINPLGNNFQEALFNLKEIYSRFYNTTKLNKKYQKHFIFPMLIKEQKSLFLILQYNDHSSNNPDLHGSTIKIPNSIKNLQDYPLNVIIRSFESNEFKVLYNNAQKKDYQMYISKIPTELITHLEYLKRNL